MEKLYSIICCRVSSDRQVKDGHGLQSQEHRCLQYSESKGYIHEKTFDDDGISGAIEDRPALRAAFEHVEKNLDKKYVMIFDVLDRIARDVIVHWAIRNKIRAKGIKIESPNFKFEETPEGRLVETIIAAQSQYFRENNARQVRQKMQARLECGIYCFSACPCGMEYKKTPEHGKLLHLKEPEASVIKTALEDFASDKLLRRTDVLNFCLENKERLKGRKINFNFVRRILSEITYAGYIEYPKWDVKRRLGFHQPLIDIETYDKIQLKLQKSEKGITLRDKIEFPLRRLVHCSACGLKMTGSKVKGKRKYYMVYTCNNKKCTAKPKNIQKHTPEEGYISLLNKIAPESAIIDLTRAISLDVWKKSIGEIKASEKVVESEIKAKGKQIDTFIDLMSRTTSDVVRGKYESRVEMFEKEILAMKKQPMAENYLNCEDAISEVLHFIGTPADYWQKSNLDGKFMVHNLIFTENPTFNLQNGFGTPEISLPFTIKGAFSDSASSMVDKGNFPWNTLLSTIIEWHPIVKRIKESFAHSLY